MYMYYPRRYALGVWWRQAERRYCATTHSYLYMHYFPLYVRVSGLICCRVFCCRVRVRVTC